MIRRLVLALALLATPALAQTHTEVLDIHHIPLGDGKVSRQPAQGMVMACQQQFDGGGAREGVPWIHGKTWDLTEKMQVSGKVLWPQAQFSISIQGDQRMISGNGLPVNEPTGTFPIPSTDPVHQWDFNPNAIRAQNHSFALPLNPTVAAQPSCVPGGMVGVTVTGVAVFDAFDAAGRDAVAHEAQDLCNGHPPPDGLYHYHGPSPCLPGGDGNLSLIGYALDGFGVFSLYDGNGREVTNADLDACHGRVDTILWDGRPVAMYHYSLTREFPYTIGCFRGTPVRMPPPAGGGPPAGGRPGGPPGGGPSPFGRPPPFGG